MAKECCSKSVIKISLFAFLLLVCLISLLKNERNISSFAVASSLAEKSQSYGSTNVGSIEKPIKNTTTTTTTTLLTTKTSSSFLKVPSLQKTANAYFFNRLHPVEYIRRPPTPSSVHCAGVSFDNSQPSDFIYRSCYFENLCIRMRKDGQQPPEFVIISSKKYNNSSRSWSSQAQQQQGNETLAITSSSLDWNNSTVALGPIAAGWSSKDRKRVEWFPTEVDVQQLGNGGHFQLDPNVILIPFMWHGASNPGHVVWDSFLPIYKLLTMFGLWDERMNNMDDKNSSPPLLLINMPIHGYLFGACKRSIERVGCERMMRKLLPLMRLSSGNIMFDFDLENAKLLNPVVNSQSGTVTSSEQRHQEVHQSTTLVCARQGVAGLGMLSDHGMKEHGQYASDYATLHNVGKSDLVFSFRNMILRNMGVEGTSTLRSSHKPYRMIISVNSTNNGRRKVSFEHQQQAIEAAIDKDNLSIERVVMGDLSLVAQLQLVSRSFFYMSVCGGSVFSATFLPRGASLILYFSNYRERPMMLDYDLLNNMAYIHVHWLSTKYMNDPNDLALLVSLIQSELDRTDEHRVTF